MRKGFGEAVLSVGTIAVVLLILIGMDENVRSEFSTRFLSHPTEQLQSAGHSASALTAALAAGLRVIAAAAHVRTLTIPVFSSSGSSESAKSGGLLSRFRRGKSEAPSVGCDPAVFAEQITDYLREAAAERADRDGVPFD